MKILYIKTISAVIFLLMILLPGIYLWFGFLYKKSDLDINKFLSEGSLNYIENILMKAPQNNWQTILNNLSPKNSVATIVSFDALPLNKKQKAQFLQGKAIYIHGANYLFLYYGTERTFVYKRIGNTMWAIKLPLGESTYTLVLSSIKWMINIIDIELSHHAQKNWPLVLRQLEKQFDIGLKLESEKNFLIPLSIKNQLKTHEIAFAHHPSVDHISIVYVSLKNSHAILKIGPFDRMPATKQFSVFQHYYFWIFSIITILIVVFLTKIFSRNVKKIDDLTTRFSQGEFNYYTSISRFSVLKGIHTNVITMGNKINALMKSQQNMTRFVAHEVRTPLSTMQLALDALNKENNLSDSSKNNILSIQEDIQDLNKLISYFLLYSQSTSHELKLKKESLCLYTWLEKLIEHYKSSTIKISLTVPDKEKNTIINFDPNLLKHAVNNLITNALKYADKEVIISLNIINNTVEIGVNDDGPGIPKSERENVFKAFTTLDSNQTFGKHIGLGLAIAKAIVDLHGGSLMISKSSLLGGSRFVIQIPQL
ncbi:MAG: HAMP domain-containing sensor histidine kinase [Gammaproteobacteria bacterium]|nr:HAMP domain-containing sensor histidine kinase [Gammaproteobacteria bacterium]